MFGLDAAALTYGWSSFGYAFGATQAGLAAGLMQGSGSFGQLIRSPLLAAGMTLVSSIGLSAAKPWLLGMGFTLGGVSFGGIAAMAAAGYLAGKAVARMGSSSASRSIYVRGAVLLDKEETKAMKRERVRNARREQARTGHGNLPQVTIAGIPFTLEDEKRHFEIVGTTGSGKTTAIKEILDTAIARGDRAIILDPNGDYCSRYYKEGRDAVLTPFDKERGRNWDLFGEIRNVQDIHQLVYALIPESGGAGSNPEWQNYARTFLIDAIHQLWDAGNKDKQKTGSSESRFHTIAELTRVVNLEPIERLLRLIEGLPSTRFMSEDNSRMCASILSITASALRTLQYIDREGAESLSVRRWVRDGKAGTGPGEGGVLFIPYKAGDIASLKFIISSWARLGFSEAMEKPINQDQRLWFVFDELDALGPIDGLKDILARVRKHGGRAILGFQSISQISKTYGRDDEGTIVENSRNVLILNSSTSRGGGTAKYASDQIGARDVIRITSSWSRRPGEFFASKTKSEHYATEAAVLPAEIEQLPDLQGYLKASSSPAWMSVDLGRKTSFWQELKLALSGREPVRESSVARPRETPLDDSSPDAPEQRLDIPKKGTSEYEYPRPETTSLRAASTSSYSRSPRRELTHEPSPPTLRARDVSMDVPF